MAFYRSDEVARQREAALALGAGRWARAWSVRQAWHPATIRFDRPNRTLPVSLTGATCGLDCAHCGGHYLAHMHPIWDLPAQGGVSSYLISGGCDALGRVPVTAHLTRVAELKQGHRLNWHVGLVEEKDLATIAPLVDVISFDIVGDAVTAREVYGLDVDLDDYMHTLELLERYAPVLPHLTVGLWGGRIRAEREALKALAQHGVERLILLVLIPTEGTRYADRTPPPLPEVADLFLDAREWLPRARLYLGCMRPHGLYRQALDELAVRAGFNVIVNPCQVAQRTAEALGLEIVWGDECCALD
ncbi:MAG: radical SAM protein [Chloroflexi bacterium]|nr:radical SAM protein [Chloroflexota bacterium]